MKSEQVFYLTTAQEPYDDLMLYLEKEDYFWNKKERSTENNYCVPIRKRRKDFMDAALIAIDRGLIKEDQKVKNKNPMTKKKFIEEIKKINNDFYVEESADRILVKNKEDHILCRVSKKFSYMVDNNRFGSEMLRDHERVGLFKLCVQYASTPIEDREIKLSEVEKNVLENVTGIKCITRDKSGRLYAYMGTPTKEVEHWEFSGCHIPYIRLNDKLFPFVRWEDEEPTKISDLLEVE